MPLHASPRKKFSRLHYSVQNAAHIVFANVERLIRNMGKGLGHEDGRFTLCLGAQSEPAENSTTLFALTLSRRLRSAVLRTSLRVLARLGAVSISTSLTGCPPFSLALINGIGCSESNRDGKYQSNQCYSKVSHRLLLQLYVVDGTRRELSNGGRPEL